MNLNKISVVLITLAIAACASTPATDETPTPANESAATSTAAESSAATTSEISSSEMASQSELESQMDQLQKDSIYFDFGEFVIKPEYRSLIQQKADLMKAHGNVIVTLEGNADERGSSEYNLALGDKRANAVKHSLELLGVSDSQTRIVSLGEEHPRLACHEEQCWKENRRVDFVVK